MNWASHSRARSRSPPTTRWTVPDAHGSTGPWGQAIERAGKSPPRRDRWQRRNRPRGHCRALTWFAEHRSLPVSLVDVDYGAAAYRRYGEVLPSSTPSAMREVHAILFGATGGRNLTRFHDQFAGRKPSRYSPQHRALCRPVGIMPALYEASPLKAGALDDVDMGLSDCPRAHGPRLIRGAARIQTLPNGARRAVDTRVYTSAEIIRIGRSARTPARTQAAGLLSCERKRDGSRHPLARGNAGATRCRVPGC